MQHGLGFQTADLIVHIQLQLTTKSQFGYYQTHVNESNNSSITAIE
jgi:hypothetical protein